MSVISALETVCVAYNQSYMTNPFFLHRDEVEENLKSIFFEISFLQEKLRIRAQEEKITLLGEFLDRVRLRAENIHRDFFEQIQSLITNEIACCLKDIVPLVPNVKKRSASEAPEAPEPELKRSRMDEPEQKEPKVFLKNECPGIQKKVNRCFAIAALKAFWSSSGVRAILEGSSSNRKSDEQEEMVRFFLDFIAMMDKMSADDVLPADHPLLQQLMGIGIKRMPASVTEGKQQDAVEFFGAIIQNLLPQDATLYTYIEKCIRLDGVDISCFIPGVDGEFINSGNILILNIPDSPQVPFDFQKELFSSTTSEVINWDAVFRATMNRGMDEGALIRCRETVSIKEVVVQHRKVFTGPLPPVLPIQLWRQIERKVIDLELAKQQVAVLGIDPKGLNASQIIELSGGDVVQKSHTPVRAPVFLTVPHQDGQEHKYALRSVVVHTGSAEGGGHYYTYVFPQRGSDQGVIVRHDDHVVTKMPFQGQIQRDIDENGYLYLYDRV